MSGRSPRVAPLAFLPIISTLRVPALIGTSPPVPIIARIMLPGAIFTSRDRNISFAGTVMRSITITLRRIIIKMGFRIRTGVRSVETSRTTGRHSRQRTKLLYKKLAPRAPQRSATNLELERAESPPQGLGSRTALLPSFEQLMCLRVGPLRLQNLQALHWFRKSSFCTLSLPSTKVSLRPQ